MRSVYSVHSRRSGTDELPHWTQTVWCIERKSVNHRGELMSLRRLDRHGRIDANEKRRKLSPLSGSIVSPLLLRQTSENMSIFFSPFILRQREKDLKSGEEKNTHQSEKEAELIRHSLAEKTLPFLTLVLKKGFSPFYFFCFCTDESHSDIDQIGGWWAKKGGNSFMEKSLLIDQEPAGGAKKRSDWPPTAWKVIEWFVV